MAVAVSGGADSVALLRLLLELCQDLGIVLSVAHFHHGIRGAEADADQQSVSDLAAAFGLPFHTGSGDAPAHARARKLSLETAARELRHGWFEQLIRENQADKIATAHTLDDQAETVLMRILRGAGGRGLAGIYPVQDDKHLVRPLLEVSRREVEAYLVSIGQPWREDSSNRDLTYLRNRVRHQLLPALEKDFNPGIRQVLADLAEVARGEAAYWDREVTALMAMLARAGKPSRSGRSASGAAARTLALDLKSFQTLPLALQRQVLHGIGRRLGIGLEFKHMQQLLHLAQEKSSPKRLTLPGDQMAVRAFRELQFMPSGAASSDYEYVLPIPGEVAIRELGSLIRARLVPAGDPRWNQKDCRPLLSRDLLGSSLKIRNWRAGDRFFPAGTMAPKKLKELLQAGRLGHDLLPYERKLWPVIECRGEIVWVRGLGAPAALLVCAGDAVLFEEVRIDSGPAGAELPGT